MAEIIDIRKRLDRKGAARREERPFLRIRLCGPDWHWLGVVGGILAAALQEAETPTAFADLENGPATPPCLDLLAGAAAPPGPGLLIAAGVVDAAVLAGCTRQTLLLSSRPPEERSGFFDRQVLLPLSDPAPAPLILATACAAGGARLLAIDWNALEQALRQELALAEALEPYLIASFETYHRMAPWAGAVPVRK
jgi:hypothetical protein